jgi:hypothetical protein
MLEDLQITMLQQSAMSGALGEELVGVTKAADGVHCRYCGSERVFRVFRQGYLQEKIYPLFGFYPWKCKGCKEHMMLHSRKRARSKKKQYLE